MSSTSPGQLRFNADLAVSAQPNLERTVKELQSCLDRVESLQNDFRQNYLQIFHESGLPVSSGHRIWPIMNDAHSFIQSNLAGNALSHLRYAADMADMACGLLTEAVKRTD